MGTGTSQASVIQIESLRLGRKPKRPQPPSRKPPDLGGIALHDAKLLFKIFLAATAVHMLFRALYIPIANPPLWISSIEDVILSVVPLLLLIAAVFDILVSIWFHFRNRFRTNT